MAVGADLVGVNQRDLVTFEVDTARAVRMAPQMPAGVVRVAESGVPAPTTPRVLAAAGYHAVLVGEHLVTSGDPAAGAVARACRAEPAPPPERTVGVGTSDPGTASGRGRKIRAAHPEEL